MATARLRTALTRRASRRPSQARMLLDSSMLEVPRHGECVDPKLTGAEQLPEEEAELGLLYAALEGLEDLAAGRVLNEAELDKLLSARSRRLCGAKNDD